MLSIAQINDQSARALELSRMPTPQLAHKWQSVVGASVEDTLPSRKVMIEEILRVEFPSHSVV
jgi:hypothetical protein